MSGPALVCEGLTRRFGVNGTATVALRGVSFALAPGEVALLVGPSGSGKTTLLSIAGGLLAASAGRVLLEGRDLTPLSPGERRVAVRGRVGFVFQRFLLLPELTTLDNVALGLRLAGLAWADAFARARALLEQLGLGHRFASFPATLSAGEQQRAAIARAVGFGPRLVLADEPTGSLDWSAGQAVVDLLVQLARARGAAVLIATHDDRLFPFATRLLQLRDGTLVADEAGTERTDRSFKR